MKINIILIGFALLCITGWTYFDDRKETPNQRQNTIEDFTFETLSSDTHKFYDNKGKIVFVHFWATWCAPCLKELPLLIKMAQEQKQSVRVLAFAVSDEKPAIKRFLEKIKIPLPDNFIIALDGDKNISAQLFKTEQLPETYILRADGSTYSKIVGAQEQWNNDKWRKIITNLQ